MRAQVQPLITAQRRVRVAINGFGRIGRHLLRVMLRRADEFEVVAVNDLIDAASLAHLLRYDSVVGRLSADIEVSETGMVIDGHEVAVFAEPEPGAVPWGELGAEVVVESTGRFPTRAAAEAHLAAGAKKVVLSAPPRDEADVVVVLGVNEDWLSADHRIISNASCTTNCLAPLVRILHAAIGIEKGLVTTVHAYTNDQSLLDCAHPDRRRARAAAMNIIPTSTGAARAVGKVIPEMEGRLHGVALRVPVSNGSLVALDFHASRQVTVEEVNAVVRHALEEDSLLARVVEYNADEIVSQDVVGNPASCVFDPSGTQVMGGNLVKVMAWYDNEWAYSNRCADLIAQLTHLEA